MKENKIKEIGINAKKESINSLIINERKKIYNSSNIINDSNQLSNTLNYYKKANNKYIKIIIIKPIIIIIFSHNTASIIFISSNISLLTAKISFVRYICYYWIENPIYQIININNLIIICTILNNKWKISRKEIGMKRCINFLNFSKNQLFKTVISHNQKNYTTKAVQIKINNNKLYSSESEYNINNKLNQNSRKDIYLHNKALNCFHSISNIERYRKCHIRESNISNKICAVAIIIKYIILLNLFCQAKNNLLNSLSSRNSIITLKIKGIGKSAILSNLTRYNSELFNNLIGVNINGEENTNIKFIYEFNQEDNNVELIWKDNIENCRYMFTGCNNITEINLANFDTSQVKNMEYMFSRCSSLTSIDLTNFNTSKVTIMSFMFYGCSSLTSINLINFNTSLVTTMYSMFTGCKSLTSIDVTIFNTSHVKDMDSMFRDCCLLSFIDVSNFNTLQTIDMRNMFNGCSALTSIDLTNFNTSKVIYIYSMFNGCKSLTFINITNFDTSLVESMNSMFFECSKLTSIDLSNFDTSQVKSMSSMFSGCSSLKSIDVTNFNTSKVQSMIFMFNGCSNLTHLDVSNFKTSHIYSMDFMFSGCSSLTSINVSNFDTSKVISMDSMFNGCKLLASLDLSNFDTSQVISMYNMFSDCSTLTSLDLSRFNTSLVREMGNLFSNCRNLEYINLENFNEQKMKEFDFLFFLNRNMFYLVPENVVICINENITGTIIFPQIKNKKCYVIDCTTEWKSKQKYLQINDNGTFVCLTKDLKNMLKDILINERNNTDKSEEEEVTYYDNILKNVEEIFTSDNYDTSNLDNGKDDILETEKMTITFTTSDHQKNNINNNMSSINLGECENLLRKYYNISNNETIYMKKIDVVQEGKKTSKVEYQVYCKLFGTNLIKLNLTTCSDSMVSISIPIELPENFDKFNSSSAYYNDICYTTTSEDGTDIPIKDRQTNYVGNEIIVCQEDCEFSKYDSQKSRAECSCKAKEASTSIADMKFNKAKLFQNFKDIKNFANFNFLICYKKLFNKRGILYNIGSYILLAIILFHIIVVIIFWINQFHLIKKKIKYIRSGIEAKVNKLFSKIKSKENKKDRKDKNLIINKNESAKNNDNNINNMITSNLSAKRLSTKKKKYKKYIKIMHRFKKAKKLMKFIDEEINSFSYNLAIQYDKRTYCQYYASLLKTQHNLICALFNNNDYNSKIIKIDLLIIGFAIEYTVNALFYSDDTMHKIYQNKGEFDLETQIPIIIYSSLISMVLNAPLNFLALTNDLIINFKQIKLKNKIKKSSKALKKKLKIKFILYFIISFLLLLFLWYYISMFDVIYKNTQMHLLKDTLMSFGLSLLIPFAIYLPPGFFRVLALADRRHKKKCLYDFSKVFQLV